MSVGRGWLLALAVTLAGCDQVVNRLAMDTGLRKRESPAPEAPRAADKVKPTKPKAASSPRPATAPAAPARQAIPREQAKPPSPPAQAEGKRAAAPPPATGTGSTGSASSDTRRSGAAIQGPKERPDNSAGNVTGSRSSDNASGRGGAGTAGGAPPDTWVGSGRPPRDTQTPPPQRVRPVPVYIED